MAHSTPGSADSPPLADTMLHRERGRRQSPRLSRRDVPLAASDTPDGLPCEHPRHDFPTTDQRPLLRRLVVREMLPIALGVRPSKLDRPPASTQCPSVGGTPYPLSKRFHRSGTTSENRLISSTHRDQSIFKEFSYVQETFAIRRNGVRQRLL